MQALKNFSKNYTRRLVSRRFYLCAVAFEALEMVEDCGARATTSSNSETKKNVDSQVPLSSATSCRALCLPVCAYRDEIAGLMLTQLLRQQHFCAQTAPATLEDEQLMDMAVKFEPHVFCISVVAPSTFIQARSLVTKLRERLPRVKIIVGMWGTENISHAGQRLRASGADEVVSSFADALAQIPKLSNELREEAPSAAIVGKVAR